MKDMTPKYCTPGAVRGIVRRIVQISRQHWQTCALPARGGVPAAALPQDEVHLWCADLDDAELRWPDEEPLGQLERERLATIADPLMQARFRRSRGLLRRILAGYVRCPAETLDFGTAAHGKPFLRQRSSHELPLHFNLSHSRSAWLLAVARSDPLGVDLELPREVPNATRLAERVFTPEERTTVAAASAVSAIQRDAVFLACWTRKEAAMKALGDGFTLGASTLQVGALADDLLRSHPRHPSRAFRLAMLELPWPGQGACAHAPLIRRIECRWITG
ncbi:MAG: 4'-phosphopantetheinyl transferase superfamily protein [Sinobacteraceae bacterium]|nr:4'-phosphopantetheinyl transferase superfamily protein [Nevskiaceae bacterium]